MQVSAFGLDLFESMAGQQYVYAFFELATPADELDEPKVLQLLSDLDDKWNPLTELQTQHH